MFCNDYIKKYAKVEMDTGMIYYDIIINLPVLSDDTVSLLYTVIVTRLPVVQTYLILKTLQITLWAENVQYLSILRY